MRVRKWVLLSLLRLPTYTAQMRAVIEMSSRTLWRSQVIQVERSHWRLHLDSIPTRFAVRQYVAAVVTPAAY